MEIDFVLLKENLNAYIKRLITPEILLTIEVRLGNLRLMTVWIWGVCGYV